MPLSQESTHFTMDEVIDSRRVLAVVLVLFLGAVHCYTDTNDARIINNFRQGMENPELLEWPDGGDDPCGPPSWPHIFCSNGRVTQIQVQGLGLQGPLPQDMNRLDKLENLGLQKNRFNGKLPTFTGLSELQFAYLDFNEFDTIPADFFRGLTSARVLALDFNPFNATSGWSVPADLANSSQLLNFSCSGCNLVGPLPEFFGTLPSLALLRLSYNRLSGGIPTTFQGSMLQILWLSDQDSGGGMTGMIDVVATMVGLTELWLHGNQFTGPIPDGIGRLTSLREFNVNGNRLVGLIPASLAGMDLRLLDLNNNMFMGPVPKFRAVNVTYSSNSFCRPDPGLPCAPEVNALLDFLRGLNFPARLAAEWTGNDPCGSPWWGITCDSRNRVSVINLQRIGLNGTLSDSLVHLSSLVEIHLEGNNLHGIVPVNLTQLMSLRLLDLDGNDFEPPLPGFRHGIEVLTDGNPKFQLHRPKLLPQSPAPSPPEAPIASHSASAKSPNAVIEPHLEPTTKSRGPSLTVEAAAAAAASVVALLVVALAVYCLKKRVEKKIPPLGVVVHPKDSSSDSSNTIKVAMTEHCKVIDFSGNLLVSLQVLRKVTNDFAQENELGRGGFGVVYKGQLQDGTKLAVKRMVVGAISTKALDEFQSEIAVLSSVRHRNLVSLLGYAVEGNERLLVYEYMPQGALSRHLFHWRSHGLEPLSWTRRLNIALDVARGVEYLHSLAHQSFIHRDLKSSNILLDDGFRAKVSDFGLVKLAPDHQRSVATRLAGTFGYLAPEYAVTGKITTKVDVFSFGVVLMELLTGLVALDEQRPEENRYLAEWFWQIKSNEESLIASIDPALDAKEDIYSTIQSIAMLAGHCTARGPNRRPEMGHVVNVLAQLVEKWKPCEETEEFAAIDLTLPLPQMLEGWKGEADNSEFSGASQDSKGSIPAKPSGFADSFTSADAR